MKIKRLYASLKAKNGLINLNLLVLVLLSASSCNEAEILDKSFNDFPNNRWEKINTIEAKFYINNANTVADISTKFSYIYGSQFSEIPLTLYLTDPYNKINTIPMVFKLRDQNNKELGDCAGDYCDIEFTLKNDYVFDHKGEYKVQILHNFNYKYIPNVLGLAVKIKHKKQ